MMSKNSTKPAIGLRGALIESAVWVVIGAVAGTWLFAASTVAPGDAIGAPEYDSFYHVRMAELLPKIGLVREFPWLHEVYFRAQGSEFVSHHVGFHLFLAPFIGLAEWLGYDDLAGGRWAIALTLGINLALFNLLLRAGGVPWRWLWLALFAFLPDEFFMRQEFIRAIGPSLALLQLLLLALFSGRWWLAGLVLTGYVWLYLGAVLFGPLVVALYALSLVAGPAHERRWPWKMVLITFAGWLAGLITYPYRSGIPEFLKLQVLGSGLTPDIEVGGEWAAYDSTWYFFSMSAPLLAALGLALAARLRFGPRIDARTSCLLLLNFAFLILTLKAQRFIEYWPLLALLSTAYLAGPVIGRLGQALFRYARYKVGWSPAWAVPLGLSCLAVVAASASNLQKSDSGNLLLADWRTMAFLLTLGVLVPLARHGSGGDGDALAVSSGSGARGRTQQAVAWWLGGLSVAALAMLAWPSALGHLPGPRLHVPLWAWPALGAFLTLVLFWTARKSAADPTNRFGRVALATLGSVTLASVVLALAAPSLHRVAAGLECEFDLDEIERMMEVVKKDSQPGDVIFTDDWDVFPVYFHANTYNHYLVGLDPKFTQSRRPDLWERYVRITRGEIPTRSQVRMAARGEAEPQDQIMSIALEDIRDQFGARYVICDEDHDALATALLARPDFAELIYPGVEAGQHADAPYLLFRIAAQPAATDVVRAKAANASAATSAERKKS